jgi:sugar phosphate isomerase/epimerase
MAMKHLFSYSVYQPVKELPRNGDGLKDIGCDGVELFTRYEKVPKEYLKVTPSVHLPYATDWYSAWMGKADPSGLSERDIRTIMFGKDRDEMVKNLTIAIESAAEVRPAYGVLHASNTNLDEVMLRKQTDNSKEILRCFCDMVNQVASGFKGNEPPFKLAFENLWWPGLKMRDAWEYKYLDEHLEFDKWGLCLDTGHLMNTLPDAFDEQTCVKRLLEIFEKYPDEMKDRIGTVHLHQSTSAEYRNTFEEVKRPAGETMTESLQRVYPHILKVDQHRPFTTAGCKLLVDQLSPDFVTHEMMESKTEDALRDFVQQRSFFPAQ